LQAVLASAELDLEQVGSTHLETPELQWIAMLARSKYDFRIIRQMRDGVADIFHGQVAVAASGNQGPGSLVPMIVIDFVHRSALQVFPSETTKLAMDRLTTEE
jgi:hypothetical protein